MRRGLIIAVAVCLVLMALSVACSFENIMEKIPFFDSGEDVKSPSGDTADPTPEPEPEPGPEPDCTHVDVNANHLCDLCSALLGGCIDENTDHLCDVCGARCSECFDGDQNHYCESCQEHLTDCVDDDGDGVCDICGTTLEIKHDCYDAPPYNHLCDVCGASLGSCKDSDSDHFCDICSKRCSDCSDKDSDCYCDVCESRVEWCGIYENDHFCIICGAVVGECVDLEDNDHCCDLCGAVLTPCYDSNGDHLCDRCDGFLDCTDDDNDHFCDFAGERLSYCYDDPPCDHFCDICGTRLSECTDYYTDGECDDCGVVWDHHLRNAEYDAAYVSLSVNGILQLDSAAIRWVLYSTDREIVTSGEVGESLVIDLSAFMGVQSEYFVFVVYDWGAALAYYRTDFVLFEGPLPSTPERVEVPEDAHVLFKNEMIYDTWTYLADPEFDRQYYAILDGQVLLTGTFVWQNGGDPSDRESFYYRFVDSEGKVCLEYEAFGEWAWRVIASNYGDTAEVTVYFFD